MRVYSSTGLDWIRSGGLSSANRVCGSLSVHAVRQVRRKGRPRVGSPLSFCCRQAPFTIPLFLVAAFHDGRQQWLFVILQPYRSGVDAAYPPANCMWLSQLLSVSVCAVKTQLGCLHRQFFLFFRVIGGASLVCSEPDAGWDGWWD